MTAADELDHDDAPQAAGTQRIDKWLWFARIIKSRTLAAQLVVEGKVRVNRVKATKPSQTVRAGDVLTVTIARPGGHPAGAGARRAARAAGRGPPALRGADAEGHRQSATQAARHRQQERSASS